MRDFHTKRRKSSLAGADCSLSVPVSGAADFGVSVLTPPRRAILAVVIVLTWRSGETGDKDFQRKVRKEFDAKDAKFLDKIYKIDRIFRPRSDARGLA